MSDFPLPERPFPGLEAFREADAAVFFGRERDIERVVDLLNRARRKDAKGFVLLLGASGCGKSSLLQAGVIPRLKLSGERAAAATRWVVPPPFRGGQGLEGLAKSMALAFRQANATPDAGMIRKRLEAALEPGAPTEPRAEGGAAALRALTSELLVAFGAHDGHVLLTVDQFEEVFGRASAADGPAMLRLLFEASADDRRCLVVLAAMRSDFQSAFQLLPGAAGNHVDLTLEPMPKEHFPQLISGPAALFNLTLGPGLTERLVEDSPEDEALPSLAFTLQRLHGAAGEGGALTLARYADLFPPLDRSAEDGKGTRVRGVSAAIKHVADGVLARSGFADLPADDSRHRDLRRAFFCLAQIGTEGQFIRRMAPWSTMPASCDELLSQMVSEQLLVSSKENGISMLSVAHETLFHAWETLHRWLLQDGEARELLGQIEDAAAEWDGEQRAESREWGDERLVDTVTEIERSGVSLDDAVRPELVRAFLGPIEPDVLAKLPSLGRTDDEFAGSARYGNTWRLPLDHAARARVGVRLDLLGEHRIGVSLRKDGIPDIDWCPVSGGETTVKIRVASLDPDAELGNTLTRVVDPFWIARYPVTITQFRSFLDHCYRHGHWCLPDGHSIDFAADYPPPTHCGRHGNHPADSVNWYDAAAFCHWLGVRLGYEIRLPTEFEWQLAAGAAENAGDAYPWASHWDPQEEPWRANTFESALNRSTAVGLYPGGAAPTGALDMAGTLFEWCQNAFADPCDAAPPVSQEQSRVLRGGSWFHDRRHARTDYRHELRPAYRYNLVGFRILCHSPTA